MQAIKDFFANLLAKIRKMTPKQIVCTVMCVLLITVIILTCVVIGKVSRIFSGLNSNVETTAPSQTTQPTETDPTTVPTTQPTETTEPTYQTEPGHVHDFQLTESVPASCQNYGYNIYTCQCGKQDIPLDEQTEPLGHSYGSSQVIAPTCTEDGYTKQTCARCGDVYTYNHVSAPGHDYVLTEEVEGTCGQQAHTVSHCQVCNHELIEYTGEAIEHTFEVVEEHTLTCTEDGYTLTKCVNCGEEVIENLQTATGHKFTAWTKLTNGTWTRTCQNSGCYQTETSADMKIQKDQSGIGHDSSGKAYKLYMIYVGTDSEPECFLYTINDFLDNGTLYYSYHTVHGLIITYTNGSGETVTVTQPIFQSGEVTIPAETEPEQTEPTPTEPQETEPVETEPAPTQPQETQPQETQPQETQPQETQPTETQPVETEPQETQPVETQPSEDAGEVTEPTEGESGESGASIGNDDTQPTDPQ